MALAWFTPILMIAGLEAKSFKALFYAIFFAFLLMFVALIFLPFHLGAGKLEAEWIWLLRPINFLFLSTIYLPDIFRVEPPSGPGYCICMFGRLGGTDFALEGFFYEQNEFSFASAYYNSFRGHIKHTGNRSSGVFFVERDRQ